MQSILSLTVWHKITIWRTCASYKRLHMDVGIYCWIQNLVHVVLWPTKPSLIHKLLNVAFDILYQFIKLTLHSLHIIHQRGMGWNPRWALDWILLHPMVLQSSHIWGIYNSYHLKIKKSWNFTSLPSPHPNACNEKNLSKHTKTRRFYGAFNLFYKWCDPLPMTLPFIIIIWPIFSYSL